MTDTDISLILVNDGSTQNISNINLERIKEKVKLFKYVRYTINKGKGYALRKGVKIAQSKFQILTDIDFPFKTTNVIEVFNNLYKRDYDVVLGYRDNDYYKKIPFTRVLISKAFRYCLKYIMHISIIDTQCGLKGFNKIGKEIFLQTKTNTFLYDLEYILLSSKRRINIFNLQVQLKEGVSLTKLKITVIIREIYNLINILFRIYLQRK